MPRHLLFSDAAWRRTGTLNDTQLRKNLRIKNTRRKSFLEHACWLDDLPIEAATARPTPRFAAHGRISSAHGRRRLASAEPQAAKRDGVASKKLAT
jgi:hypothetical protein